MATTHEAINHDDADPTDYESAGPFQTVVEMVREETAVVEHHAPGLLRILRNMAPVDRERFMKALDFVHNADDGLPQEGDFIENEGGVNSTLQLKNTTN